ncbi:MAG: hypothetical protein ACI90S_001434, partial [Marinobacter psychrophilus]
MECQKIDGGQLPLAFETAAALLKSDQRGHSAGLAVAAEGVEALGIAN